MNACRVITSLLSVIPAIAVAESASLHHVNVFGAGEAGYSAFRIPAIETAPNGSLLAVSEARKHNRCVHTATHNLRLVSCAPHPPA